MVMVVSNRNWFCDWIKIWVVLDILSVFLVGEGFVFVKFGVEMSLNCRNFIGEIIRRWI